MTRFLILHNFIDENNHVYPGRHVVICRNKGDIKYLLTDLLIRFHPAAVAKGEVSKERIKINGCEILFFTEQMAFKALGLELTGYAVCNNVSNPVEISYELKSRVRGEIVVK